MWCLCLGLESEALRVVGASNKEVFYYTIWQKTKALIWESLSKMILFFEAGERKVGGFSSRVLTSRRQKFQ